MAAWEHVLAPPPVASDAQHLWLDHAAGFILFQDVREYALSRLSPTLNEDARKAAEQAVNDAVYGLMMVLDGVTGSLKGEAGRRVELEMFVRLREGENVVQEHGLSRSEGMCMGFHGWLEGDFGNGPIVNK